MLSKPSRTTLAVGQQHLVEIEAGDRQREQPTRSRRQRERRAPGRAAAGNQGDGCRTRSLCSWRAGLPVVRPPERVGTPSPARARAWATARTPPGRPAARQTDEPPGRRDRRQRHAGNRKAEEDEEDGSREAAPKSASSVRPRKFAPAPVPPARESGRSSCGAQLAMNLLRAVMPR